MVRLQQDIADYRAELKLIRTQTPAVSTRYWDSVQTTVDAPAPTPEVPALETTGDRHTESSTSVCELSSGDGIRTVDASIPRETAAATATTIQ